MTEREREKLRERTKAQSLNRERGPESWHEWRTGGEGAFPHSQEDRRQVLRQ